MKRIKRLVALIGVVLFVCSAPTTAYAKADGFILSTGAEELIAVGGAVIGTETALGWALSMLGFTAAANTVYENRDEWMSWCSTQTERFHSWLDDRAEDLYCTTQQVDAWLKDVANGALDTTSECWDAFLDYCCWLDGEVSSQEGGGTTDITWTSVDGVQEFVNAHSSDFAYASSGANNYFIDASSISKEICCVDGLYFTNDYCTFVRFPNNAFSVYVTSLDYDVSDVPGTGAFAASNMTRLGTYLNNSEGVYPIFSTCRIWTGYIDDGLLEKWQPYVDRWLDFSSIDFSKATSFTYYNTSLGSLGLVSGIALGWDGWCVEVPDVTPKDDVSDVIVAPDTSGIIDRDGSLDNVRVGDATGELVGVIGIPVDGIGLGEVATPYVGVPGVYPVDTVTGEIVGTDTPIEDVTPEKIPTINGAYTIDGLEDVFPFCVPFDMVALYDCMTAEPQAPKIKIPFPVGFQKGTLKVKTQEVEIDLSKFDTVAKVLRAMELLGFCIGLTLITRKLIRG